MLKHGLEVKHSIYAYWQFLFVPSKIFICILKIQWLVQGYSHPYNGEYPNQCSKLKEMI